MFKELIILNISVVKVVEFNNRRNVMFYKIVNIF